jgi:hypothetical protein
VVLVLYARHTGSALRVLGIVVLLLFVELCALFGAAVGDRCGDSRLAGGFELAGAIAILVTLGTWGVHRRRIWPLPVAIVAAAIWVVVIAHVIPGGAGGCFE